MTRWWSIYVWVVGWVGVWQVAWIDVRTMPALFFATGLIYTALLLYRNAVKSGIYSTALCIPLPITRKERRHNTAVRLHRREEALQRKADGCRQLCEYLEETDTRRPVLIAEADAALWEKERVREDLERLRKGWELEDWEREYRRLVA